MTEKQKNKSLEYLSQFKEDYDDRTLSENILIEGLYHLEFEKSVSPLRYLGSMESILLIERVLKPGDSFDFLEYESKFLGFTFKVKENYQSFIIRKTKDFLKEREII